MNADSSSGGGHGKAPASTSSAGHALLDRPLRTEPIRPAGDAGDGWGRAAAYDAYADGLHTYAIWSLRDHDAAVDALYCAFVLADRNVRQLRQPEHIHPWLYALLRRECTLRGAAHAADASSPATLTAPPTASSSASSGEPPISAPSPVSGRLRPPIGAADPTGSLAALEQSLRRAEFHSLQWPESEGLSPAHQEILELTIRHGLDSQGLGLVLGLGQSGDRAGSGGFGVLADAWRELERSLAAVAVARAPSGHCAQLAELTFGWSGRLTGALRAPLTDHVDGCPRCQHYLHTVIGTPAAPTILPFIAAPRKLREILLSELRDPELALRHGVDHNVLGARIRRYTPDGFPVTQEAPPRRRGARRAAPKRSTAAEPNRDATRTAVIERPMLLPADRRQELTHGQSSARDDSAVRPDKRDSWPHSFTATETLPTSALPLLTDEAGCSSAPVRPGPLGAGSENRPDRDRSVDASASTSTSAVGRSALHGPAATHIPSPRAAAASGPAPLRASASALAPASAAGTPSGRDGKTRAQHRARPLRKAVLSAMTLGAAGAAAAATAALLGVASGDHGKPLIDAMPSQNPADSWGGSGLTVTVSTPPVPLASSGVHSSRPHGPREKGPDGDADDANLSSTVAAVPGSGGAIGTANAADFHVSVNQRAADPNSVTIVLRNTGSAPIAWQATAIDPWIVLSQSSGILGGGQSLAVMATATSAAPTGQWTSTVSFAPGGAVVTLHGGYADPSSAPKSPTAAGPSGATTPGGTSSSAPPAPPATSPPVHGPGPSAVRPTHTLPGGHGSATSAFPPPAGPSAASAGPSSR